MAASSSAEPVPSDSFTPRRAQKGYSELNVNHIFTGTNQLTVSLSHRGEFNQASALRTSPFPVGWWTAPEREGHDLPNVGVRLGVFLSLGKGNGHCEGLVLVCMALWYPSHDRQLVSIL